MGTYSSFGLGTHLHMVFSFVALAGVVLFVIWAAKQKPADLKKWLVWSLAIGVVGMLVTSSYSWRGSKGHWGAKYGMTDKGVHQEVLNDCLEAATLEDCFKSVQGAMKEKMEKKAEKKGRK